MGSQAAKFSVLGREEREILGAKTFPHYSPHSLPMAGLGSEQEVIS